MNLPKSSNKSSPERSSELHHNFERMTKRFKTIAPMDFSKPKATKRSEVQEVDYLKKMLTGTSKELEYTEMELNRIREEFHEYREKEIDNPYVGDLNILHKQLNNAVSSIDKSTQKILKTQEKELIQFFNAKLNELKMQFQADKEAKIKEILEMSKQGCEAANELNTLRITVHFIEQQNTKLISENRLLKSSLTQTKEELNFLTQRYSKLKQERLQTFREIEKIAHSLPNTPQSRLRISSPVITDSTINLDDPKIRRNELYIKNLQKALDIERENLKKMRILYNQDVGETNELKSLIKECLLKVRIDINCLRKDKERDMESVKNLVGQMSSKEDLFISILNSLNKRRLVRN